MDNIWDENPL